MSGPYSSMHIQFTIALHMKLSTNLSLNVFHMWHSNMHTNNVSSDWNAMKFMSEI